jgi:hypothetical protein
MSDRNSDLGGLPCDDLVFRTTHEEAPPPSPVREGIRRLQARGCKRPVVLHLHGDHPATALIRATLPEDAEELTPSESWEFLYVVWPRDARKVLAPIFGSEVDGFFRGPLWPVSFWNVRIRKGVLEQGENQLSDLGGQA